MPFGILLLMDIGLQQWLFVIFLPFLSYVLRRQLSEQFISVKNEGLPDSEASHEFKGHEQV